VVFLFTRLPLAGALGGTPACLAPVEDGECVSGDCSAGSAQGTPGTGAGFLEPPGTCEEAGKRGDCSLFGPCREFAGECKPDPCWTLTAAPYHVQYQDPTTGELAGSCGSPEPSGVSVHPSCVPVREPDILSSGQRRRSGSASPAVPEEFRSRSGALYAPPRQWGKRACCRNRGGLARNLCGLLLDD
jgi:hypothetical protein